MFRLILILSFFISLETLACSSDPGWFEPSFDKNHIDANIPPDFKFSVASIKRGRGSISHGNGFSVSSSCDDIGTLKIKVQSNNDVDPCEYGFYIYETTHTAPQGLIPRNPIQPIRRENECVLSLSWLDGASWVQDQIDLVLEFEAVNNYLYKGDRSSGLKVFHDGYQKVPDQKFD
jgi:hypothetical protein